MTVNRRVVLSKKQQQCLTLVAAGTFDPYKGGGTVRSLERLGLIEHVSMGWRTTTTGDVWLTMTEVK